MATIVDKYSIQVDTKGAISGVNNLKTALGGLAAALSVGALVKFSDQVTSIRNKLNLLQPTAEGVQRSFEGIAAIAALSRAPLEQTADLYFRIARSADSLGISQQEAANITMSVAKALSASGLSAQEAAGPLLQLGQALQSGTFQGDELRSILEGLPPVSKALANSLGVPVGALKTLGSQGKITGQDFVRAMRQARDAIEKDFARTVPTISQAAQGLRTNFSLAFNNFEQRTQTGQRFAAAIEYLGFMVFKLSKNIDSIVPKIALFVKIIGSILAFTAVGRILRALVAVFAEMGAGLAALGTAISIVWGTFARLVTQFKAVLREGAITRVTIDALGKRFHFLGVAIATSWQHLSKFVGAIAAFLGLDSLGKWFKDSTDKNSEANKELQAYREELAKLAGGFDQTAGSAEASWQAEQKLQKTRAEMGAFVNNLARTIGAYKTQNELQLKQLDYQAKSLVMSDKQRAITEARMQLEQDFNSQMLALRQQYSDIVTKGDKDELARLPLIEGAMKSLTETYNQQVGAVEKLTSAFIDAQNARQLQLFATQEQIKVENELLAIQDDIAKMTLPEIERKYIDIEAAARNSAKAAIEAEEARRNIKLPMEEQQKYYDEARKGVDKLKAATLEQMRVSRDFSTGWARAMNDYIDNATNAATRAENIFKTATRGMEEAIVNFAKTGKFEWRNFVEMMLEELLRSQIQQVFAQILGTMNNTVRQSTTGMGSAGGGNILGTIISGLGSVFNSPSTNPLIIGGGIGGGGMGTTLGNIFGNITGSIGSVVSGIGSGLGSLVKGIGNLFGGLFANGGTLGAGKWGIAGERGPELITGPANIYPLNGMGGGVTNVTYNIQAVDAASFKQLVARDPGFIHAVAQQGAKGIPNRR